MAEIVADGRAADVFDAVGRLVESGQDLKLVVRELTGLVRDLMVVSVDPTRLEDPELSTDAERLQALAARFSREDLLRAFDVLARAEQDVRYAAQPRYHLEMALLRWIHLGHLAPIAEVLDALGSGRPLPSGATRPVADSASGRSRRRLPVAPGAGTGQCTAAPHRGRGDASRARRRLRERPRAEPMPRRRGRHQPEHVSRRLHPRPAALGQPAATIAPAALAVRAGCHARGAGACRIRGRRERWRRRRHRAVGRDAPQEQPHVLRHGARPRDVRHRRREARAHRRRQLRADALRRPSVVDRGRRHSRCSGASCRSRFAW